MVQFIAKNYIACHSFAFRMHCHSLLKLLMGVMGKKRCFSVILICIFLNMKNYECIVLCLKTTSMFISNVDGLLISFSFYMFFIPFFSVL